MVFDLNVLNGFYVASDLHPEAALMCLDSLRLPSCTRNPHVGSSVSFAWSFGSSLSGRTCVFVLLSCTRAVYKRHIDTLLNRSEPSGRVGVITGGIRALELRIMLIANYVIYGTSKADFLIASTPIGLSKIAGNVILSGDLMALQFEVYSTPPDISDRLKLLTGLVKWCIS
ncbi:hypothetical protein M9H77_18834 [Catharanthus roseus]|uniref:Uncharacterized protein n=1 Tax=Catharanthus roseus TaxID=4058 RepID=A0ACC0B8K4_CATRO|nr:hypothetical protein M9H77_18834 [Catharanthus roseus]